MTQRSNTEGKKVDLNLTTQRNYIINEIRRKMKAEKFEPTRRRSIVNQVSDRNMVDNDARVFDDNCAICLNAFDLQEDVCITPCKHTFHEDCIMGWLKAKAEEALKMKVQKEAAKEDFDIEEMGPQCPNCQASLLKAVGEEEQRAMTQVANIVGLLTSSNLDSVAENMDAEVAAVDPNAIRIDV